MNQTSIIIQSILVFIVFVIGMLIYLLPSGKKSQNLPLCIFLVIVSLHILIDLTIDHPIFNNIQIHLFPSVFIFLYAPLLYFYTNALLGISVQHKWRHLLLFFAFTAYYLIDGFLNTIFFPVYGIQYMIYAFFITRLFKKTDSVKRLIKTWSFFLVYSFGLIWFFAFISNIMGLLDLKNLADQLELMSYLVSILFFIGLIYFTMSQPKLFMNIRISKSNKDRPLTNISDSERQRVDQIKTLFEQENIYTDPALNRELLANKLGIDVQQLSKEINQHFKMNLSELINHHRIQEAQKMLKTGSYSIKEVYYQVGFNSRSAFNTAFKKIVGKTPSEYKKSE